MLTIERIDRVHGVGTITHFHERNSARLTGISVTNQVHFFHVPVVGESDLKILFSHMVI
jgi:hypothetical protein